VDGGGKFSTAVLFVALGAAGAFVFTRAEPPPQSDPTAWSDSLVRRVPTHPALALPRDPVEGVPAIPTAPPIPAPANVEANTARLDWSGPAGVDARPQGRYAAQYWPSGANPYAVGGGGSALDPTVQRYFGDDASYDPERTPLNNLATMPSLPPHYPAALPPSSASAGSAPPAPAESAGGAAANASAGTGAGAPVARLALEGLGSPLSGTPTSPATSSLVQSSSAAVAPASPPPSTNLGPMTPVSRPTFDSGSSPPTSSLPSSLPVSAPSVAASSALPAAASASGAPAASPAVPRFNSPRRRHQVRDGDTLVGLALRYYNDASLAPELFEANRAVLSDPELLPIGVPLIIPQIDDLRGPSAATAPGAATSVGPAPAAKLTPKLEFSGFGAPPPPSP